MLSGQNSILRGLFKYYFNRISWLFFKKTIKALNGLSGCFQIIFSYFTEKVILISFPVPSISTLKEQFNSFARSLAVIFFFHFPLWGLLIKDLNLILLQKIKSKYTVFVYFPCTTPSIASHDSYHLGYNVIFLDDIWLILTLEDHLQQYTVHH